MNQTTANYCEAVRQLLVLKGLDFANAANHAALETDLITLDQFHAAARILVRAYLEDHPTKGV